MPSKPSSVFLPLDDRTRVLPGPLSRSSQRSCAWRGHTARCQRPTTGGKRVGCSTALPPILPPCAATFAFVEGRASGAHTPSICGGSERTAGVSRSSPSTTIFSSSNCSTTSGSDSNTADRRASSSTMRRVEARFVAHYRFAVSKFSSYTAQQTGAFAVDAGRRKRRTTWSLRSRRPTYLDEGRRAPEIIVIGYSLPQTDADALSLLDEIAAPPRRPRITLVCGPKGAPETYSRIIPRSLDTKLYLEDYVASILS